MKIHFLPASIFLFLTFGEAQVQADQQFTADVQSCGNFEAQCLQNNQNNQLNCANTYQVCVSTARQQYGARLRLQMLHSGQIRCFGGCPAGH